MLKLLIVDDQPSLLSVLKTALEDEYEIRCVASGEEALAIMQDWQPDVVITDFEMPGMDGVELIRKITDNNVGAHCNTPLQDGNEPTQNRRIKIILASARFDPAWTQHAVPIQVQMAGADAYLAKPFDLVELKVLVRELVEKV